MTSTSRASAGSRTMGRTARRMIVVELPEDLRAALPRRLLDESFDKVVHARFADLSAEQFEAIGPDTVLAPLLTKSFDAVELAEYLAALKFAGSLIVVSAALPHKGLVAREIARAAAGVSVELFELNTQTDLRQV